MSANEKDTFEILEREKNQPIHQWAYKVLRTNIIELHLRPAQQLSENEISDRLGISRTPVREAFIRLAEDGLLVVMPQKKSVVSLIDMDQAEEARFIRRALEKAVIKEVCGRLTETDQADLEANLKEQHECGKTRRFDRMLLVDNDFHRIIFRACRKERSWAYIKKLDYNYDRLRVMVIPHMIDQAIGEHGKLLEILKSGNTAMVDEAVDGHLTMEVIRRVVGDFPSHYFVHAQRKAAAASRMRVGLK